MVQAVVADVRVRESANRNADVVATLSSGQQARTTASTVVADGYTWTDIELLPSGIRGWAAIAGAPGTDPWLVSVGDGPLLATNTGDISALESTAIGLSGSVELVDPATGEREPLTSGAPVTDLAAAPDGKRAAVVVFGRWIELIQVGTVTNLQSTPSAGTRTFGVVRAPRFSPDGLAIAHLAGDTWSVYEPQIEWYGTGAPPQIASVGPAEAPAWSPDGTEIWTAFTDSDAGNYQIAALGLDGAIHRLRPWAQHDGSPAPAPDGRSVGYLSDDIQGTMHITVASPDGSGRRVLYTPPFVAPGYVGPLRWQPAGSRVAMQWDYSEDPENEPPSRIYVLDAATGEHSVFDGPGVDCGELTWSPTGTRLAMVCRSEPGSARHLFVMAIDGSGVVDLGPAMEIDWAPDLSR